jgi:hypothetical protein
MRFCFLPVCLLLLVLTTARLCCTQGHSLLHYQAALARQGLQLLALAALLLLLLRLVTWRSSCWVLHHQHLRHHPLPWLNPDRCGARQGVPLT